MKPDNLPLVVAILPLQEPLLLPGTVVPFDADEEWLQSLSMDVLGGEGYVGVIQVMEPEPGMADEDDAALFTVGCLGRMEVGRPENPDEYLVGGLI
ncbi:MAG: hypothetical protein ACLGI9_16305, partial [Thermoanaerobaculia bacterium]